MLTRIKQLSKKNDICISSVSAALGALKHSQIPERKIVFHLLAATRTRSENGIPIASVIHVKLIWCHMGDK
jgi:hypothetical protein